MSYILEALKRAEEQRGTSPRALPPPGALPAAQPSRARWPWIAGVVAGVAALAAVVVVFWTMAVPRTSPPVVAGGPPPVDVAPPPRAEPPARVRPGLRVEPVPQMEPVPRVEPAPRVEPGPRVKQGPRVEPRPQRPPEPARPSAAVPRPRPTPRDEVVVAPAPSSATPPRAPAPEPVPPVAPTGDIKALTAKLSLQVLTWAPDPRDRFVFLSGRKYVEGQTIDDKLLVERITEDGVVLSFQGQRVTLKSQ